MKFTACLTVLIALVYPCLSLGAQCAGTSRIVDPEAFTWTEVGNPGEPGHHYVGTLEIAEATLSIDGETITTRVYRQQGGCDSIPGPTITMTPGNRYVLKFRNRLDYEPASEQHNVFRNPNVSNLHTHGLHTSGETPGDDVTRNFEGQTGGDFVYDIPADHMGGTFWYHAHHHGSTYLQVSAGAFGLIVIDDRFDEIPDAVAAMEERQLVVAYLDPDVAGTGGDTLISGSLSPTWTVNGRVNGTLTVPPDTWLHWRVLLADRDARSKTVTVGPQCEVALMARDGVWRTEVPKPLPANSIKLTGASRADLAVRCSSGASISVAGQTVASIEVEGTSDPYPSPWNDLGFTWYSKRPVYLRDLRSLPVAKSQTIVMGARTINDESWNPDVPTFMLDTEGVQQFVLLGATNHPFHLHIYHVQMQDSCGDFEAGEYYDVVDGNCTIRFALIPADSYRGRTVMHCHILAHEDQGAMGWADVIQGQPPPEFPAGFSYTAYIPPAIVPGSPPSAPVDLTATAVSSSEIDLGWVDTADNEAFFQVERSPDVDPLSFTPLDTVNANVESYSDLDLAAATRYWYRLTAVNDGGNSPYSNSTSDITAPPETADVLAPGGITVSAVNAGNGRLRERAVVVVEDNTGSLVEGATVAGHFTGTITENASAVSLSDGSASLSTQATTSSPVSFEFCVNLITKPGSGLADFVPRGIDTNCARFQALQVPQGRIWSPRPAGRKGCPQLAPRAGGRCAIGYECVGWAALSCRSQIP